jgi:hypothetical protein
MTSCLAILFGVAKIGGIPKRKTPRKQIFWQKSLAGCK